MTLEHLVNLGSLVFGKCRKVKLSTFLPVTESDDCWGIVYDIEPIGCRVFWSSGVREWVRNDRLDSSDFFGPNPLVPVGVNVHVVLR